jgi:hypothetical protein
VVADTNAVQQISHPPFLGWLRPDLAAGADVGGEDGMALPDEFFDGAAGSGILTRLKELNLRGTKVTDAGIQHLRRALPRTNLITD